MPTNEKRPIRRGRGGDNSTMRRMTTTARSCAPRLSPPEVVSRVPSRIPRRNGLDRASSSGHHCHVISFPSLRHHQLVPPRLSPLPRVLALLAVLAAAVLGGACEGRRQQAAASGVRYMAYCPHHVRQSLSRPPTRTYFGPSSSAGKATAAPRLPPPPQQQPSATTLFGWTTARTVVNLWGRSSSTLWAAGCREHAFMSTRKSSARDSALTLRTSLSSSKGTMDCSSEEDVMVPSVRPTSVAVDAVDDTNGSAAASGVEENASARANKESTPPSADTTEELVVPLCLHEGLFSVIKPQNWTSNDVVAYLRGILERDARNRGAIVGRVGQANGRRRRSNNDRSSKNKIRVGHGGTLDPLATGVLVIGVGSGTKQLQNYLKGSKRYRATAELGYETTTLDTEGPITRRESADHISDLDQIQAVLPHFVGKIQQVPPLYSALKKDGIKLYEKARQGATVDDVEIEAREVEIYGIELRRDHEAADPDAPRPTSERLPKFDLDVECGGGTYIRSLVRDIGYKLGTCATTTYLERTKQGPFTLSESLPKELWSAESIYTAIDNFNRQHASRNTTND